MTTHSKFTTLGLFDAKVPRYTSYPTAPHFGADTGPDDTLDWLRAIPEQSAISLYLHIPFCRRLCWFCACRTQGTLSGAPVVGYVDTLVDEIRLLARTLPKGIRLDRLHWGGGTPTMLSPQLITRLADTIRDHLPFAGTYEFSVEIDPNEIDQDRVTALSDAGMNRASIGVQDFDADIQNAIGRQQSYEITAKAVGMLRQAGVHSLNADILFGLPHQTRARITASVQKLLTLDPDRVALYGYAHVPWMARRQTMIPSDTLPTPGERLDLFGVACDLFKWDGYDAIGIDHFARPEDGLAKSARAGTLRRNFQGYTDDQNDVLIGLGASAISRFPQGYAQNQPATSKYTAAIQSGAFATSRGHRFSAEDRLRAQIIERVMCDFEIRLTDIPKAQRAKANALFDQTKRQFGDTVKRTDAGLVIPPASRPLTRMIARSFDAYDLSTAGHSSAI